MEDLLRDAVAAAAGRAEVGHAVADVYATLADAIELRRPICTTSGRCCRFEEFGHRLYVSTIELAKFVDDWKKTAKAEGRCPDVLMEDPVLSLLATPVRSKGARSWSLPVFDQANVTPPVKPGCPFQLEGLCGVHAIRPFGCRIFFCDETSTEWQHQTYELLHGRLRKLHEDLEIPYFYVEWRFALRTVMSLTITPE